MITKAIILSINQQGNTAMIRIPFFETAGCPVKAICEATFAVTPGTFNGYIENDVVFVAFNDNDLGRPTIIGKLYLGVSKENERQASVTLKGNQVFIKDTDLEKTITDMATTINTLTNELNLLIDRIAKLETKVN